MELSVKVNLTTDEEQHKKYRNYLIQEFYDYNLKRLNCYESLKGIAPAGDVINFKNELIERYNKAVPRTELGQEITVHFGYRSYYESYSIYRTHTFISIPELNYHIHKCYDDTFYFDDLQIITPEGLGLIQKKLAEIREEIEIRRNKK